jgi:hypothetical protein
VHCDDWIYAVHDGQLALSLVVFSGVFPPTVPADTSGVFTWPKAATLMLCEKHHDEVEGESRECFFLGRCMIISDWCSYAQEVWSTCGGKTSYEQEEGFWRGLEAEFFDQQKRRMGVEYTRELGLS